MRLLESNCGIQQFFAPLFCWIDQATANGHNVLIHCLAGAHRAGSTAIAFLMHAHGMNVREATIAAKRCRPCIEPLGGFAGLLVRLDVANQLLPPRAAELREGRVGEVTAMQ